MKITISLMNGSLFELDNIENEDATNNIITRWKSGECFNASFRSLTNARLTHIDMGKVCMIEVEE